jgi:hypothetical protein
VHYHGDLIDCDESDLEDFVEIGGEWYHHSDVIECPYCGENYVTDEGYYSDVTGREYCCYSCQCNDESDYISENWYYSELTDEYYETEQELKDAEEEYKQENGITEEEE